MYHLFKLAAEYCEEIYGSEVIEENGMIIGFICPECGEFIYSEDWTAKETENWMVCPICLEPFGDEVEEEEEE